MSKGIIGLGVVVIILAVIGGVFYQQHSGAESTVANDQAVVVEVPAGLDRLGLARALGARLGWGTKDEQNFASTYAQMQWAEFNAAALASLRQRFEWTEEKAEVFLTHSRLYFAPPYDFFSTVYEPGIYNIPPKQSLAQIAGLLLERSKTASGADLANYLAGQFEPAALAAVEELVTRQFDLLPDLVPLPAQDLKLERHDGKALLMFSTTYYNQGTGPLELIGDPKTAGIRRDVERDVLQKIYRRDGGTRERVVGTFLWHQPHLHYHFADFITYDLVAVDVSGAAPDLSGVLAKTTFCIRDVSRVELDLPERPADAVYEICQKERQGISVGWGDTYFYNYPEQSLNVVDLPAGTYRLTFQVNPDSRLAESDESNNVSSILLKLDVDKLELEVLEQTPASVPKVEHIYPEQKNCSNCVL